MKKLFCDRCKCPETDSVIVWEYRIQMTVDAVDREEGDLDYTIEAENMDLCQPCVREIGEMLSILKARLYTKSQPAGAANEGKAGA